MQVSLQVFLLSLNQKFSYSSKLHCVYPSAYFIARLRPCLGTCNMPIKSAQMVCSQCLRKCEPCTFIIGNFLCTCTTGSLYTAAMYIYAIQTSVIEEHMCILACCIIEQFSSIIHAIIWKNWAMNEAIKQLPNRCKLSPFPSMRRWKTSNCWWQ